MGQMDGFALDVGAGIQQHKFLFRGRDDGGDSAAIDPRNAAQLEGRRGKDATRVARRNDRIHFTFTDQLHRPDPNVPFEDSVGVLAKMREEGKIRHVGLSNVTIVQLAEAQRIVPIVTVQNRYNLAHRESERMTAAESEAMIDICAREGIGFMPWFPLATGELAHRGGPLDQIVKQHSAQPSQIALAWLLRRSSSILPIPGTSSVKHLEENVIGATIKLTQEEFDTIDRISKP